MNLGPVAVCGSCAKCGSRVTVHVDANLHITESPVPLGNRLLLHVHFDSEAFRADAVRAIDAAFEAHQPNCHGPN